MNPSHHFSKPHLHLLQVHRFPQIFPGKRKMVLQGWPHCQPPCAAPCRGVTVPGMLYGRAPPGSTVCSAALCHPELFHPPRGIWAAPAARFTATRTSQMYKLSCGEVLQRPWKRRARGENLHILFQIPRASQDSLRGVCVLFILGDDTGYLSRFKCSVPWDCSRPLGPSRVWELLLQQHRLDEGSSAGPAARAAPCRH